MTGDRETAALLGHVPGHQRDRNLHIKNDAAPRAMDVIVAIGATVIPAGLVGEGEFLNFAVQDQQVERSIDGAVGDPGIALADLLEHIARGQVLLGVLNDVEHGGSLRGAAVGSVRAVDYRRDRFAHHTIAVENKSRYQPRLYHSPRVGIQKSR